MTVPPLRARLRERIGTAWADRAACRGMDTDLFYPIGHGPGAYRATRDAQRVCATCPVARQCLQYALLLNDEHGIWGGLTPEQRRALRAGSPPPAAARARRQSGRELPRRPCIPGA